MDEMQQYEVRNLIESITYVDKNQWEMCRASMYLQAQMNSKKQLKPSDILKFKWDEDDEEQNQSISNADIERLKIKAKQYIENTNE